MLSPRRMFGALLCLTVLLACSAAVASAGPHDPVCLNEKTFQSELHLAPLTLVSFEWKSCVAPADLAALARHLSQEKVSVARVAVVDCAAPDSNHHCAKLAIKPGTPSSLFVFRKGGDLNKPVAYTGDRSPHAITGWLHAVAKLPPHAATPTQPPAPATKKALLAVESEVFYGPNVVVLDGRNFDEQVKTAPNVALVAFVSPSCPHCQALEAHLEAAASVLKPVARIGVVDCVKEIQLCSRFAITQYPTLKVYRNGVDPTKPTDYPGDRSSSAMITFLTTLPPLTKSMLAVDSEAEANVEGHHDPVCLTEKTLQSELKLAPITLVSFEWKSCTSPELAALAQHLTQAKVSVARVAVVDCAAPDSKRLCASLAIKPAAPPSLYVYRKNDFATQTVAYTGDRSPKVITAWLQAAAQVHPNKPLPTQPSAPANKKALLAVESEASGPTGAVHLDAHSFDGVINAAKLSLVMFCVEGSGPCMSFANKYDRAAFELGSAARNVALLASVDCASESTLCERFHIHSFPSFLLFRHDVTKPTKYEGLLDAQDMIESLTALSRIPVPATPASSSSSSSSAPSPPPPAPLQRSPSLPHIPRSAPGSLSSTPPAAPSPPPLARPQSLKRREEPLQAFSHGARTRNARRV